MSKTKAELGKFATKVYARLRFFQKARDDGDIAQEGTTICLSPARRMLWPGSVYGPAPRRRALGARGLGKRHGLVGAVQKLDRDKSPIGIAGILQVVRLVFARSIGLVPGLARSIAIFAGLAGCSSQSRTPFHKGGKPF